MKTVVIYKDASEYGRVVTDYIRDFYHQTGKQLDVVDPDTKEGSDLCQTYDIVEYPTLLATDDNGTMQNMWTGLPLPLISEVSYYVD